MSSGLRPKKMEPGDSIPIDYENVEQTNRKKLDLLFTDSSHVGWRYNLGKQKLSRHGIKTQ
jgi:hypothetical protein